MKCKTCGKNADSEYCFRCKPRRPLAQTSGFKQMVQKISNSLDVVHMHKMFMHIWDRRPHNSEVSGERLSSPPSSAYFHHILEKEKYPEAKFDEENIILLTLDEHHNVDSNMYKYERINFKREYLITKYNL
jgi:hypothetical protein